MLTSSENLLFDIQAGIGLALIAAMDVEFKTVLENMQSLQPVPALPFPASIGLLAGRPTLVCQSGVGKVAAAASTQCVISCFQPRSVVMVGVAGALSRSLRIGDIVLGERYVQHDVDALALGLTRGVLPDSQHPSIPGDKRLLSLASSGDPVLPEHGSIVCGNILSGDQFLNEEQTKVRKYLFDEMAGTAIDMESAASAWTCSINRVPFLSVRVICSELDGSQEAQFEATHRRVVKNFMPIVDHIAKHL